jgi:hypothetical protein
MTDIRRLSVFLCHSSTDKKTIRDLYQRLSDDGYDPWLDEERLLPGQEWDLEIRRAVKQADVVLVCLSNHAVTKEGYVQKEIRIALDLADEKPEGVIFLIPVRLDDCKVPSRLEAKQWVDIFTEDGYQRLLRSLDRRATDLGVQLGKRRTSRHVGQIDVSEVNRDAEIASHESTQVLKRQISVDISAFFDRQKYKDIHKGFRSVILTIDSLERELRPMELRDPIQKSMIFNRHGYPIFPTTDLMYSTEKRLPIGIAFEHELDVVGPTLMFSIFGLSANVFTVESLWEDTRGTRYPEGSVGLFSCYQLMYAALLFGRKYYPIYGLDGEFQIQFSFESSIPRNLVMDARNYFPLFRVQNNDMSNPITIGKSIAMDASLTEIDLLVNQMIREFCWYFHLDLSEEEAAALLETLKKENVAVPKEILQSDNTNHKDQ